MMTPDEAGTAMAADPTFGAMTPEEREEEAARLLGGFATPSDDPLEIALALEVAELVASVAPEPVDTGAATAPGIEPCRMNGADGPSCGGQEPIAGNGRCMTCGAVRRLPETAPALEAAPVPATAPPRQNGTVTPGERDNALGQAARPPVRNDLGASFLGRFKEATGCTDREVSAMLGMSRATVQAYVGGRLPEKLDTAQVDKLTGELALRLMLVADLKRELHAAIGEIE